MTSSVCGPSPPNCFGRPLLSFSILGGLEDYPHAVLDITYTLNENARARRAARALLQRRAVHMS